MNGPLRYRASAEEEGMRGKRERRYFAWCRCMFSLWNGGWRWKIRIAEECVRFSRGEIVMSYF